MSQIVFGGIQEIIHIHPQANCPYCQEISIAEWAQGDQIDFTPGCEHARSSEPDGSFVFEEGPWEPTDSEWEVWLDDHCDSCGDKFQQRDLDGGRCVCGAMIGGGSAETAKKNGVGPGKPVKEDGE